MNKRQKRAAKIAAQQALTNGARAAGRELTPEEQTQFDALQREIDALTLEIEAEERQEGTASLTIPEDSARAKPIRIRMPKGSRREPSRRSGSA